MAEEENCSKKSRHAKLSLFWGGDCIGRERENENKRKKSLMNGRGIVPLTRLIEGATNKKCRPWIKDKFSVTRMWENSFLHLNMCCVSSYHLPQEEAFSVVALASHHSHRRGVNSKHFFWVIPIFNSTSIQLLYYLYYPLNMNARST